MESAACLPRSGFVQQGKCSRPLKAAADLQRYIKTNKKEK
jgi:hypothetical protein